MGMDPVRLTEAYPKAVLHAKRLRAALTGKIHFFNGQRNRSRVFDAIDKAISFENYIETGTFLGMTTDFLARTATSRAAQVYSCELHERHFAIANRVVGDQPNVHLHLSNSVDFLLSLSQKVWGPRTSCIWTRIGTNTCRCATSWRSFERGRKQSC